MTRIAPRDLWILLGLTALATATRVFKLDAPLWYDEILTLVEYARLPALDIVTTYKSLNNHLMFSLEAHYAITFFGESAWCLRLPSALLGIITVPLLWAVVWKAGAPLAVAHVAALLVALNYHHIWFSQNARGYTGLVFFSLAAVYFLQDVLSGRQKAWIGVALCGAAAMYTHLSAAFFLFALFLSALAALPDRRYASGRMQFFRHTLFGFAAMGGLVLLLYIPVMGDIFRTLSEVKTASGEGAANPLAHWENPLLAFRSALDDLPGPLFAALIGLPAIGVVLMAGWLRLLRLNPLVAWSLPFSVVVTILILQVAGMRIWPRFFLVNVVQCLVIAPLGVAVICDALASEKHARTLTFAGWALGVVMSALWASQNYVAPKQNYAGAIALAEAQAESDDGFATFGLSTLPILRYYRPDWQVVDDAQSLQDAMQEVPKLWVVMGFKAHSAARFPGTYNILEQQFDRVAVLPGTMGGGFVYVYRSPEKTE